MERAEPSGRLSGPTQRRPPSRGIRRFVNASGSPAPSRRPMKIHTIRFLAVNRRDVAEPGLD
jgi:hypothetical protein